MEFFEKAHVSKRDSSKKDTKSEEVVKKQLKQMLQGFKKSDNDLIMSSGNAEQDIVEMHRSLDDSVSVSGFSDLNLTYSDAEEDISQESTSKSSTERISSGSDISVSRLIELESIRSLNTDSQESSTKLDPILEASTEDIEESMSDDDDIKLVSEEESFSDSNTSEGVSLLEFEETSTDLDNTDSERFDPDGSLACKILEKLHKSQTECTKKGQKRKLEDKSKKVDNKSNLDSKPSTKNKKKNKTPVQTDIKIESLKISTGNNDIIEETLHNNSEDSVSTTESSPFVSISASEMDNQSFSDILGGYRHPTVRNLPCEKQNVIPSDNSMFFVTESMEGAEDIDSLIPELGDDIIIEDLEAELDNTEAEPIEESTEVDDNTIQSESTDERESLTDDYKDSIQVYYVNNSCIFILKHPMQLYINGKVKVIPLGGTIEVFGHILKEEVNIFAPNNSFAQCLKTVAYPNKYYGLFGKLTASGLSVSDAECIVTSIGEHDCVFKMSKLNDVKIAFVENNCSVDLFSKPNKDVDFVVERASKMLGCNLYLRRPKRYFEENECWLEAVKCGFNKYSRGIVCGGKGLGKSTFVRYYVNRMLENGPVLVIDLDPGQAEFTVAGCVSATVVTEPLIGPNFTHLKTPEISLNVGLINTMDNTIRFAKAIATLLHHCRSNEALFQMPWVINTMGMTTQMGLQFLLLTIIHAQPTFLMQIDTTAEKKRFSCHLQRENMRSVYDSFRNEYLFKNVEFPEDLDYTFILTSRVDGSNKHDTSQPAKMERYLNFLAYFGQLLEIHRNKTLLGIVPYEVKLSDLKVLTNVKVAQESILKVINGKIVGLCQLDGDNGTVFTLDDKAPLCHGHGLVRGVDFEKRVVYVVSPAGAERLRRADALLYADWAPELGGGALPDGAPVPYRSTAHHKHRQLMLSPRRRFNPLQLIKMSRSA